MLQSKDRKCQVNPAKFAGTGKCKHHPGISWPALGGLKTFGHFWGQGGGGSGARQGAPFWFSGADVGPLPDSLAQLRGVANPLLWGQNLIKRG